MRRTSLPSLCQATSGSGCWLVWARWGFKLGGGHRGPPPAWPMADGVQKGAGGPGRRPVHVQSRHAIASMLLTFQAALVGRGLAPQIIRAHQTAPLVRVTCIRGRRNNDGWLRRGGEGWIYTHRFCTKCRSGSRSCALTIHFVDSLLLQPAIHGKWA